MTPPASEIKQLRSEVEGLKELLRTMQQGQQLQFQALQAFLETSSGSGSGSKRAGDQPEPTGTVVSTFKPLVAGNPDEVGGSGVGDPKDEAGALAGGIIGDPKLMSDGSKALDEEIRHFVQYFGYSVKEMERFIKDARDGTFFNGIDKVKALNHFVRDDCLEPNDQDECEYISARFMMLAGPDSPQKTIKIRDYYNDQTRDIHDMLYFELPTDDELWKFLSRPRSIGGKPDPSKDDTSYELSFEKIDGRYGMNESGGGEYPAYGREIIVETLTPNNVLILLTVANEMCRKSDTWSASTLGFVEASIEHALNPEHYGMGYDDTLFKRHMFSFDVTFFEMFNPSDDDDEEYRQDPLGIYSRKASQGSQATDQENSREFGSPMRGPFTPGQEDTEHIRETTISLLLDSLQAEKGSYWTLISIGKYDEEAAYKNPLERSGSGCPRYLSPEEVFLDKLARVIDWAVDDGMADCLSKLEMFLDVPHETLFSKENSEKLLFDDARFTRTKKYHWAMQWLGKWAKTMEPLISEINDMEERGLPELRKFSNAHKARAGIVSVKGIDELSTEKAFRRKATRARDVRDRINAKINEVKDLRDALVNASGVLESRAAVSQAETVYTLTILMIVYLPVTTIIGVFGMNVIPEGSQTLKAFWISLCGVFIATSLLGLNLGSVLAYASTRTEKLTNKLQVSMSNIGGSWKTRSHTLKVISEAEQLMTRDHRVPASWFYTWYAILWTFFIFPAQELGSAGGIIHLVNKTSPGSKRGLSASGGWFWGAAVVPLRILLLPVHVVFLLLDYILLVIFSVSIVGRDISTGKESTEDHASTSRLLDSGKKGDKEPEVHESDALVDKPASPTPVPAWKSRFTAPITTLQEFSKFGSGLAAKASEPPKIEVQVDPSIVYPAPDSSTVPLLHIQTNTEGIESSPSQKEPGSPVYKALQHALENAKARNAKILAKTNDEDSDTESSCDPESSDSDSDDDEAGEAGGKTKDNADAGDSGSKTEDDGDDGSGSGSSTEDDDDGDDGSGTEDEDSHHKGPNSASLTTPLKATPYRLSTVVASRPPIIEEPQSIREGSGGSISELMGGIIRGKRSEERDLEKGT